MGAYSLPLSREGHPSQEGEENLQPPGDLVYGHTDMHVMRWNKDREDAPLTGASFRVAKDDVNVSRNAEGGCVGAEWQNLYFARQSARIMNNVASYVEEIPCQAPAEPRTCPTPSMKQRSWSAEILAAQRWYCEEHWQRHLAREVAFVAQFGPVAVGDDKNDILFEEEYHPDYLATGPLTNIGDGFLGCAVLLVGAILLLGVGWAIWHWI